MKKYLIVFILLSVSLSAAVITGNQDKVSVTGGSISVTGSDGVSQTVNSGEISFTNEKGASKARKIKRGDLNDVYADLKASDGNNAINIKFAPLKYIVAKKIKAYLVQKGIDRSKIRLKRYNANTQIYIVAVQLNRIKKLYPEYYSAGMSYFKKPSNKGKIPTMTMKKAHINKYHKSIIRKYDR